jgi:hypothetical protein
MSGLRLVQPPGTAVPGRPRTAAVNARRALLMLLVRATPCDTPNAAKKKETP